MSTAAKEGQIVVCSAGCKGVVIRKSIEEQTAYQREEALWAMGETCLTGGPTVEVLDLIHACSYVWKAVQALHPGEPVKNQAPLIKDYVGEILCGNVHGVIRGLRWKATHISSRWRAIAGVFAMPYLLQ